MAKIFILEDDESIREAIERFLIINDFQAETADSCKRAVEVLSTYEPDLAILDIKLPDGNGLLFARNELKDRDVPFLFLTSNVDESDRITGLELGASDYISKPFSLKEMVLRIQAILRRTKLESTTTTESTLWTLNGSALDYRPYRRIITVDGDDRTLTMAERLILVLLVESDGALLSREAILQKLEQTHHPASPRTVDSHIRNLRLKLGRHNWIEAVRGFGFRFAGERQNTVH